MAEPYAHGMLDVGDGNQMYWEICGNPDGKPLVLLHGGPGQGCMPGMRDTYDLERYRVVLYDQRGCGRSTPSAADPSTDMSVNTTAHLIADLELLREYLGIDRWLVRGASWGCTLALAYAQRYPHRVSAIVLSAIMTCRREEIEWLYGGASRFFPEEYERFAGGEPDVDHLLADYARRLASPDREVQAQAAMAWGRWEDVTLSLEPNARPGAFSGPVDDDLLAITRICAHYFANNAWLDDGELIRNAGTLAGIPGALTHGRLDLSCPVTTAYELAAAWPGADLFICDQSGHRGSPAKGDFLRAAVARLA
ncbi:prolyl aminopeptidase [Kutzneria chonburiensis]|uniref:Proline iminopeptidase n=1 Tax=Kutzneria chonburiensis TaxID=1483604 RepID=A0ABV6N7M4_9PSEU|nr:prolyl aminopeptidase [Kutzneria chonburiensis]